MNVSVKELRTQPARIIDMANAGNEITITLRGKPAARIVPLDYVPEERTAGEEPTAFGMWKDRKEMKDPVAFVNDMRKGRNL